MSQPRLHKRIFADDGTAELISHDALPVSDRMPDQTNQNGKFLHTDGSKTSWEELPTPAFSSISLNQGASRGTLRLKIDGVDQPEVLVRGLSALAYKDTASNDDISDVAAEKITSGTIDPARLPATARPKLVVVANDTERFALTSNDVLVGDTVKVTATKKMYMVKDDTVLGTEAAFEEYLTSTDWSVVSNKPTTVGGYGITDAKIESGVITLGSNTITPLTSHQDISGKINVSGSRGTLAGYETSGTATTISESSADSNQVSSSVTVSNGSSGTSWTKIVRFTSAVTVTKGSSWVWANGEAPTIAAGGVMVCCWCGSGGIINYISPSA